MYVPVILTYLLTSVVVHSHVLHWSLTRYNPRMAHQCIRFDICLPPRDNVLDFYTGERWTESDSMATEPALDEVRPFSPSLFTLSFLSAG
jgi:hypothetical protein